MGIMNSFSAGPKRLVAVVVGFSILTSCGGCDDDDDTPGPPIAVVSVPSAPQNLTANVGTNALSLGWDVPTNNGGSSSLTYEVEVSVAIGTPTVLVTGTRALISNVVVGRTYTVAVRARNSAGLSAPTPSLVLNPQVAVSISYAPVIVSGDPVPAPNPNSGIFDPSVLRLGNGEIWMSYSAVSYYNNASSQLVQDVGIRLARSVDNGVTFSYASTIATPSAVTLPGCGAPTCSGRWVYETSWLINDSTDPDPARRYKLFAHKYFLNPGNTPATFYHLGAIVMWTASAPDAMWSGETSLMGWNSTPAPLTPLRVLNAIDPAVANCVVFSEGSASVRGNTIDFAFACPELVGGQFPQKIVLIRTSDHANTFQYVSTLLTPTDAPLGAKHLSAPALLATPGAAPVLIVTPVKTIDGTYDGCMVFPIANDVTGELFRVVAGPVSILSTPSSGLMGGACTYDRNLGIRGILQNSVVLAPGAPLVSAVFTIQATQAQLQRP
jgi:hypothetical protein